MLTLIYGGSGSGKSEYAEGLLLDSEESNKYYIATMKVSCEEDIKRVNRHKRLRAGKGFTAIESETDIDASLLKMDTRDTAVLLECMSNLVANEMFKDGSIIPQNAVTEKILSEIKKINKKINNFFIVTNDVFDDGCIYDETTEEYLKALGTVNMRLSAIADNVYEVVVGLPVRIK